MPNDSFLWTSEEYQAVVDYKGNSYSAINVLLSDNVTEREKNGKEKILPKTPEEFKKILKTAIGLYSAIRKDYMLNGGKPYEKKLFRGGRIGKVDSSFLSTSDTFVTAFDFARMFEKRGNGILYTMESGNVPYINVEKYIFDNFVGTFGEDGEPELLFLPCQYKKIADVDISECIEIAENQGERISIANTIKRKFGALKCEKVELEEVDYSKEKSSLSEEDLCTMFSEYRRNLEIIRENDVASEEYKRAYQEILEFKKNCCTWVHQKFYEINQNIDNQMNIENDEIQVSSEYNMEPVFIGNTGDMYLIQDQTNNEEYYFKPALSKNGAERPYRAHIQEAGYLIQRIINPEKAIKCQATSLNGMFGAIQQKIPIDSQATKSFIEYFNKGKGALSPEMIAQIMDEYLVDFCLCNYDAHASNFIVDKDGNLRGIDKEQSFRYIKEDTENDMTFSVNYNESYGEKPTIYSILFEQMKQGVIPYQYLDGLRYRASRLAQYPDEQYRQIFEKYAYGKTKTPEEAESLLSNILSRKNNILMNVELLHSEIYNELSARRMKESVLSRAVHATEEQVKTSDINIQASIIRENSNEKQKDVDKEKV